MEREWKKKDGDRSRGLGMWEVRSGGVRNDSGFWVESLQLNVMPLKEKRDMRGKTGLGNERYRRRVSKILHVKGGDRSVPSGPTKPTTCVADAQRFPSPVYLLCSFQNTPSSYGRRYNR